MLLIS